MTPNKYYLVMEYCEGKHPAPLILCQFCPLKALPQMTGGDLLQFINSTPLLSDELARTLFRGLIEGIHFCHVLGIHHRDLKLENLMLTSRDETNISLKIADFGLSDLQTLPSSLSATFCGSPLYAAPELMTAGAAPDGYDAAKSDVWSCGVILYALLASALPFDADDISALVRLIQRGVPNSPLPESRGTLAAELVSAMLTVDPKTRPIAADVRQHAWLQTKDNGRQIKSSVTTMDLKSTPAADAPATGPGARRRGATATTRFFKDLKQELLEEEGSQNAAPASNDVAFLKASAPALNGLAPAAADAAVTASVETVALREAQQQQQQQQQQQPSHVEPTPPPPAPPTNPAKDDAKRQQGRVMTKGEFAAIKLAIANGEVEDPPEALPAASIAESTPGREPQTEPAAEASSRKGGAPLTKDEWEEIRRERREAREARERAV